MTGQAEGRLHEQAACMLKLSACGACVHVMLTSTSPCAHRGRVDVEDGDLDVSDQVQVQRRQVHTLPRGGGQAQGHQAHVGHLQREARACGGQQVYAVS